MSFSEIKRALQHDFDNEKEFSYKNLNHSEMIRHFAKFISGIWQIHPFREGNTRTIAVFAIKYLRAMGFTVSNDLFAEHSWHFRNALVRANYRNYARCIEPEFEHLEKFFRNLLLDETNELKNRYLVISAPEEFTPQVLHKLIPEDTFCQVLSMASKSIRLSTGSIFPKGPGEIYFYRYQVDGHRKTVSLQTANRAEALRKAEEFIPIINVAPGSFASTLLRTSAKVSWILPLSCSELSPSGSSTSILANTLR